MTRTGIAVLVGLGTVVLAIVLYLVLAFFMSDELREARGWTVLQGLEVKYRGDPDIQSPILVFNPLESSYVVLGLPTEDARYPRAWIILNETQPNSSVYMLPRNERLKVRCTYVDEISAKVKLAPPVLELLRAQCAAS